MLVAVCATAISLPAQAEEAEKIPHRVPKVSARVSVDGVLDEVVWDEALMLELNYEVRPGENVPPPVRTEVFFAYDDSRLYVAYRCYDPDPSQICARVCDRDHLWDDDWVALVLDTFNDQRRNFLLVCNPFGVQADNIEVTGGQGAEWDAIWDSAGRINEEGYVIEIAVPFSSLRFQRSDEDQVWGVDAIRSYPRGVRHHIGLFPRDRNNNCYLCQAEKLIGFAGATPGRGLEFDPTFSTIHTQSRPDIHSDFGPTSHEYEVGITGRWGFTPNLTLTGAVNPDFSQVEADAAQLDVNTQFALYYPERRPFFLEGADFFSSRMNVVYTRTLADPVWGGKVTGKEGSNAIGAFVVSDEVTNLLLPGVEGSDATTLAGRATGAVIRYRRDIGSSSTLGMFLTNREGKDYYNRLIGIDGDFRFTKKDLFTVQILGTKTKYPAHIPEDYGQPEGEFDGVAYDLFYLHDTRGLDWFAVYRDVDSTYRSDLGFRPMVGFRYREAGFGHTWFNDADHWYTMLNFGMGYEYEDQPGGELIQRGLSAWFDYNGRSQSWVELWTYLGERRYQGIDFDGNRVNFEAGFWPSGSLVLLLEGSVGEDIDYANVRQGSQLTFRPYVEYKLGRHLELGLRHTYQQFNVEDGRLYTANIGWLRAVYQFSIRSFLRVIVQYVDYRFDPELYIEETDEEYRELSSQVLFSYKVNPQTMLFLGYSDFHYGDQDFGVTQTDRTVFAKIGYAWVP
jgi:hypothetical protein